MKRILAVCFLVVLLGTAAHADDPAPSKGDFVSSTIKTVFDKLGQYATGEKKLIDMGDDSWRSNEGSKLNKTEEELDNITIRSSGGLTGSGKP